MTFNMADTNTGLVQRHSFWRLAPTPCMLDLGGVAAAAADGRPRARGEVAAAAADGRVDPGGLVPEAAADDALSA